MSRPLDRQDWTLPGGTVKPGESVEASLLQILRGLGLSIHDYRFAAVVENMAPAGGKECHEIRFLFEVNLANLIEDGFRGDAELKWFWWGDIDDVDIHPEPIAKQLRDPQQEQCVWSPWETSGETPTGH
ncbi:NUDIX domain-containing protein [Amycolatopsis sacchari]|uniref:NUDIX domain-containing protein n=1 Tax=Amycolatopsis sacchari TaxID=115433 RepID=UPI003EBEB998